MPQQGRPEPGVIAESQRSLARTHVRRLARPPLRTLLLRRPLICGPRISNYVSDQWSYGDLNPRPLACHQQAAHPQQCVRAGQRLRTSVPVLPDPGRLRYFSAVLSGVPRRESTDVAVPSATCIRTPGNSGPSSRIDLTLLRVREFRLCILMQNSAFPFVISNVVRYTWLSTGTHPSGWAGHRIGRRVVGTARRHSARSYPAFKDKPSRDSGTTRGHVTGELSEPPGRRGLGSCPSISQVPAALGGRCAAVCRAGLLAVAGIHLAGGRGHHGWPARLALSTEKTSHSPGTSLKLCW